ncbi:MAG TPA: GtrA family protein [Crenotrichaceae bacterium]|nr:GtrA family protein [Crenotrichaceae bacterium]
MSDKRVSYNHYPQFFIIGSMVGIATVLVRELISILLKSDGRMDYLISICGAYGFGIIASFTLQRLFTFRNHGKKRARDHFIPFTLVALGGCILVALLSFLLRYTLLSHPIDNEYAATIAFITASLLVSIVSYWVNAKFVFR